MMNLKFWLSGGESLKIELKYKLELFVPNTQNKII